MTSDLLGMGSEEVLLVLRQPDSIDRARWTYLDSSGSLVQYLYFKDGKVESTGPLALPIQSLRK
jgi:hypothetical protein